MKKMISLAFFLLCLQSCVAQSGPVQPNQQAATQSDQAPAAQDQPTKSPAPPKGATVVCIDPGHPSETSAGNVVQNGTTEVHIAWQVALKLKALLEAQGIKVVMTKSREDELVTNKARAPIANRAGADLMIRLHCDASADNGYAVYSPDRKGTVQNQTGPSDEVIARSKVAAEAVHQGLAKALEGVLKDGGVRGDSKTAVGSKQG